MQRHPGDFFENLLVLLLIFSGNRPHIPAQPNFERRCGNETVFGGFRNILRLRLLIFRM